MKQNLVNGSILANLENYQKLLELLPIFVSLDSFQVLFQLEMCESMLVISQFICYPQSQSSSPFALEK